MIAYTPCDCRQTVPCVCRQIRCLRASLALSLALSLAIPSWRFLRASLVPRILLYYHLNIIHNITIVILIIKYVLIRYSLFGSTVRFQFTKKNYYAFVFWNVLLLLHGDYHSDGKIGFMSKKAICIFFLTSSIFGVRHHHLTFTFIVIRNCVVNWII